MAFPSPLAVNQLRALLTQAMGRIEAQEAEYQTITIGELIAARAKTHGSQVAIDIFERNERATYSEVDLLSNKYANALHSFGVRKGDRIGVMLPNRLEHPILWFAFAKLGAIIVPIDVRYTSREIEYVLNDTQATFAIIDESTWPMFLAMDPWPHTLSRDAVIFVGQPSSRREASFEQLVNSGCRSFTENVQPDDLLDIQFTSGTTGLPKGCMLTHDYWGVSSYQSVCGDAQPYRRYFSTNSFSYGDAKQYLLRSYRQGGTYYLAAGLTPARYVQWLRQHRIEWCAFPELVARHAEAVNEGGDTHLKQTLNWGYNPDSVRKFRRRFQVPTQDAYGMTEIWLGTQMLSELDAMADSGSVGVRAPFRNLRLMSDDGRPVAVGEVGELWVNGRGIFKGYWNKPEVNAASFDRGWFKTGDLLRCDELGFYWFVGRTKDMIRRSGDNIAAREVEGVIRQIQDIADVAAVPVHDADHGEEVKIYVELRKTSVPKEVIVRRILEHAHANLAAFKIPRYIAFTSALPRAVSSNKVLKRELMTGDPLTDVYDAKQHRWR